MTTQQIKYLTYLLFGVYALLILITFQDYGITTDEHNHIKNGADVLRWYTSGFQDRSVFQSRNTHLYGGLFDTLGHIAHRILPLDPFDASHLCNALLGLLGVIAAYRIGLTLGGPTAGLLSALALLLIPRFYGHAFNNPKDIPFAVFYLCSLDALIRGLEDLPHLPRRRIWHLGLSIGATLAMRTLAAVLVGYMGVFFLLKLLKQKGLTKTNFLDTTRTLIPQFLPIFAIAYILMILFWPWAHLNPILHPFETVSFFSRFPEQHPSFFEGRYVISTDLPWYYAPKWLLIALPEFVFLGLAAGGIGWLISRKKQACPPLSLQTLLLLTSAFFPLAVVVLTRTPLYDGLRHILFIIPPLGIAAVLGLLHARAHLQTTYFRRTWTALIVLLMALTAWDMVRLHPHQYIYFNRLFAGGLETAAKSYETDYWQNSFKEGIRWIETQFPPRPSEPKYRIGSLYLEVAHSLDSEHYEYVQPPESADFYLGITRFDRHRVVPGKILHIIRADNVPLLYILRPDSTYKNDPTFSESPFYHLRQGKAHEQAGRLEAALKAYQTVLEYNAGLSRHYLLIGNFYDRFGTLNQKLGRYAEALKHYGKALKLDPENPAIYNNIGITYIRQKNNLEALNWFQKAIHVQPDYTMGHVNIGNSHLLQGNAEKALKAFEYALTLQPDHPAAQKGREQARNLLQIP